MPRHYVKQFSLLAVAGLLFMAGMAQAAVIGQWTGSTRSWNAGDFGTIRNTMTSGGHTVEADGAITAANLANDDMFVIGEANTLLNPTEVADLLSWVSAGGVLWLGVDSGSDETISNSILSGLGSTMSFTATNSGSGGPLAAGNFATNFLTDIVGQSLTLSLAREVIAGGGLLLSGNLLGVEQIGSGWVFASGDRFEQDFSNSTPGSVNGQLLLNIAGFAGGAQVPAPATLALMLVGLGLTARRRRTVV